MGTWTLTHTEAERQKSKGFISLHHKTLFREGKGFNSSSVIWALRAVSARSGNSTWRSLLLPGPLRSHRYCIWDKRKTKTRIIHSDPSATHWKQMFAFILCILFKAFFLLCLEKQHRSLRYFNFLVHYSTKAKEMTD